MEEVPEVNIATACRLCLINEDGEEMISIDNEIFENIHLCGLKIYKEDDMPNRICRNCHNILQFIHKFRKMCENSDVYLREFCCKQKSIASKEPQEQTEIEEQSQIVEEQQDFVQLVPKVEVVQEQQLELEEGDPEFLYDFDENANESVHEEMIFENHDTVDEEVWIEESCEQDYISDQNIYIAEESNSIEEHNKGVTASQRGQSKVLRISKEGKAVIEQTDGEETGDHVCEICGNRYRKLGALEAHRRRHQNQRPFECEICASTFVFNFQLERHMRKHTGDRPFTCEYCNRKFVDRSTMSRHQKIHRNERAYKCDTCGKSFTYYSVLKTHIMSHTGEKPYCCGICGKCFHRASDLRNHLETLQHRKDPRAAELIKNIRRKDEWC